MNMDKFRSPSTAAGVGSPFHQLVQRLDPGAHLLRTWPLTGGVSAQVTAIEFQNAAGDPQRAVVRQHGERDRAHNPHIAADEFRLLQILETAGVAAPRPYIHDTGLFPHPVIVMEFVEGATEFAPDNVADFARQLAHHLVSIHTVRHPPADLAFLPRQDKGFGEPPAQLDHSLSEGTIRDALERLWPLSAQNAPVLLHGDYWPGNVLWNDGRIRAVIDWEDAAVGDPLADIANCRLELLWAVGQEAMDAFTEHYRAVAPIDFTNLAYWELCAALRPAGRMSEWGLDPDVERLMRKRHRWFVDRILGAA